jgi:hypothetical protein
MSAPRIGISSALLLAGTALQAQSPGRVTGTVYDSLARGPLASAAVALVSVRDSSLRLRTVGDAQGRFAFDSVPAGPWVVTAEHPRLDSLALHTLLAPLDVRAGRRTQTALAIPSARVLPQRVCGVNKDASDTSGYLVGRLRRAVPGAPSVTGTVRTQWVELLLAGARPSRELVTVDVPTDSSGRFVVCGTPANGTVLVRASSGADSSGRAALALPASGIRYRDLYVGQATAVELPAPAAVGDSTAVATDSLTVTATVRVWRGNGRLSGVIRDANGRALGNARVAMATAGRDVRTDTAGRFVLDQLPTGTQSLEVRAIGYEPLTDAVDVLADAAPLTLAVQRFEALDTVRVRAQRAQGGGNYAGFLDRRKRGTGKFFVGEDIDRLNLLRITDLFYNVGGIVMMTTARGDRMPTMRGVTFAGRCVPTLLVDGYPFPMDALDALITPNAVIGVEVYSSNFTPGELSRPFASCGTIAIWTGRRDPTPPKSR